MDWKLESLMAARIILAALLGAFIGWERERHGREAGIRTFGAVALGACAFALVSGHAAGVVDTTRIAAQVVTGIGFLGAGVIMHRNGNVEGLTTAATLWASASVGLAVGFGMYTLATLTALMVFGLLFAHHLPGWNKLVKRDRPSSAGT